MKTAAECRKTSCKHTSGTHWRRVQRASTNRDLGIRGRDRVAARMTPAQIAEAQRLAREWDAAHPAAQ
jgi:hypothetical protein